MDSRGEVGLIGTIDAERLDESRRTDVVGCSWLNYPCCVYHRALIGYPTRFASQRLVMTTSLIVGKDQGGSADVEVQTTDGKAEMCNGVED